MKRVMINRARYRKIKLSLASAVRTSLVTSKTAGSAAWRELGVAGCGAEGSGVKRARAQELPLEHRRCRG